MARESLPVPQALIEDGQAVIAVRFDAQRAFDSMLDELDIKIIAIWRNAADQAGRAWRQYCKAAGKRSHAVGDFLIGVHALIVAGPFRKLLPVAFLLLLATAQLQAADAGALIDAARIAETKLDCRRALELYLAADQAQPNDAFILQKISRQYSDLIVDLTTDEDRRKYAQIALEYSQRAVALEPKNAENVLSLAVCYGKLSVYSDTRTKIKYSRLVKEAAERALALDPNYAWAHHILGRWNYEVATLGAATRLFVRLIYGGLPDASTAEAVKEISLAVELEPGELAHQLELGFALVADGQNKKARAQFEKSLSLPSRQKYDDDAKKRAGEALAKL